MTTIQVNKSVAETLNMAKEYPKQTYNELIEHMIKLFMKIKKKNQYDEFLHKIQKEKMAEIWDNSVDEVWESV